MVAAAAFPVRARTGRGAGPLGGRLRRHHGGTGDHQIRHRGAETALPAAHPGQRGLVVPGLFRARRRLRSRGAENQGHPRRRSLCGQWFENLDHHGSTRRHDVLPGAHRDRRQEAGGDQLPADRYAQPRHHRAADRHHRRRHRGQRSILRRCPRAGGEPHRRGGQGLDLCQVSSRPRAHQYRPHRLFAPHAGQAEEDRGPGNERRAAVDRRPRIPRQDRRGRNRSGGARGTDAPSSGWRRRGTSARPGILDPQNQGLVEFNSA